MEFGLIFLGAIILLAIGLWSQSNSLKKRKDLLRSSINEIDNFSATQQYIAVDGVKGIAFDEKKKRFVICSSVKNKVAVSSVKNEVAPLEYITISKIFSYQDILSAEVFYDDNTVTKTNRTSQAGGALVGGLALGGVGVIVGGLSGKTTSKKEVEKIELRIIVNDKKSPIQDIKFLNTIVNNKTPAYLQAEKKARHWFAILSLLIEEADKEDQAKVEQLTIPRDEKITLLPTSDNDSIAGTLSQLNELFEKGILTKDEFSKAKQKALGVNL